MQIAYTLPDDGIVPLKSLHRFQYDPMMSMVPCTDSVFDERWTSHDAYGFRAPNLPPSLWEHREQEGLEYAGLESPTGLEHAGLEHDGLESPTGLEHAGLERIPLYRLHHIGLVTLFMIERTLHPIKTWKRIIITYSQ